MYSHNMSIWSGIKSCMGFVWIKWKKRKFVLPSLLSEIFLNRRKREARQAHKVSQFAQRSFGLRAKLFNQKRFKEKAAMKKTLALHQQGTNKHANDENMTDGESLDDSYSYFVSLH
jgi:hypothetical protein